MRRDAKRTRRTEKKRKLEFQHSLVARPDPSRLSESIPFVPRNGESPVKEGECLCAGLETKKGD